MVRGIAVFLLVWFVIWGAGLWLSDATRKDLREVVYQGAKALICTTAAVVICTVIVLLF